MWARVNTSGKLVEFVTFDPDGKFHPDIRWVRVPDHLARWVNQSWTADAKNNVHPPSLDALRRQARPKVAAKRWQVETQTPIPVTLGSGASIDILANDRTTSKVDQTLRLAEDYEAQNGDGTWQVTWKAADASFHTITLADLRAAWQALGAHVAAAFGREADINAKLDAAGTVDGIVQVIADELDTGWPQGGGA
jgi:hypothetical protein